MTLASIAPICYGMDRRIIVAANRQATRFNGAKPITTLHRPAGGTIMKDMAGVPSHRCTLPPPERKIS
jgi:hypothetical protein